jgi:alpha-beta hydrolase superfamily lysophospholipase
MPSDQFSYRSADDREIVGYRWDSDHDPLGVVVLVHGMGEHVRRYDEVAGVLTGTGVVVYGQDHRGHGASIGADREPGDLAPGGWGALVDDIGRLIALARSEHPHLPLVLLAHSMGSFAVQQFLLDRSAEVDGVVLTGTAAIDLLEPALDLSQDMDLALFNAGFQPSRTDFDWLSRDEAAVDAYLADPLCGFGIDSTSMTAMFAGARRLADPAEVAGMRRDLPILVVVGDKDPVNGDLALMWPLVERYRDAGVGNVTVRVYEGGRHEVLNESNRTEVFADLLSWLAEVNVFHRREGCSMTDFTDVTYNSQRMA